MRMYQIFYYDVVLETLNFHSLKDAVIYCGVRHGGKVGINIKEI